MSSPNKSTGKRPQGKGLSVNSIVRLSGLTSEKGRKLNNATAKIVENHREGRYAVQLLDDQSKMKIQTLNLRVVCSACYVDQSTFQFCSKCKVAAYCDSDCQKNHWKTGGHKQSCKELDEGTSEWKKSEDHSSWKQLTQPQRKALRKYHLNNGCKEAWPVSCETAAMLDPITLLFGKPSEYAFQGPFGGIARGIYNELYEGGFWKWSEWKKRLHLDGRFL